MDVITYPIHALIMKVTQEVNVYPYPYFHAPVRQLAKIYGTHLQIMNDWDCSTGTVEVLFTKNGRIWKHEFITMGITACHPNKNAHNITTTIVSCHYISVDEVPGWSHQSFTNNGRDRHYVFLRNLHLIVDDSWLTQCLPTKTRSLGVSDTPEFEPQTSIHSKG